MFSVILNLEDNPSLEYVTVVKPGEDFLESTFEHGGEFNILSVEPLVCCRECKHSRTDDIFGGRWCQLPGSIKRVREEFFCADGERKYE